MFPVSGESGAHVIRLLPVSVRIKAKGFAVAWSPVTFLISSPASLPPTYLAFTHWLPCCTSNILNMPWSPLSGCSFYPDALPLDTPVFTHTSSLVRPFLLPANLLTLENSRETLVPSPTYFHRHLWPLDRLYFSLYFVVYLPPLNVSRVSVGFALSLTVFRTLKVAAVPWYVLGKLVLPM